MDSLLYDRDLHHERVNKANKHQLTFNLPPMVNFYLMICRLQFKKQ